MFYSLQSLLYLPFAIANALTAWLNDGCVLENYFALIFSTIWFDYLTLFGYFIFVAGFLSLMSPGLFLVSLHTRVRVPVIVPCQLTIVTFRILNYLQS